jgi:hypothetical protein
MSDNLFLAQQRERRMKGQSAKLKRKKEAFGNSTKWRRSGAGNLVWDDEGVWVTIFTRDGGWKVVLKAGGGPKIWGRSVYETSTAAIAAVTPYVYKVSRIALEAPPAEKKGVVP